MLWLMSNINAHDELPKVHELLGDPESVCGRLALLGWPSLRSWAMAHGHSRQMVFVTVRKWGKPRSSGRCAPHGRLTQTIIRDLLATMAEGRRPADEQKKAA